MNPSTRSTWQLQTARAQFSEIFRRARTEGPQFVTSAGKETVVGLSIERYEELTLPRQQPKTLIEFFRSSPLVGADLDFERDPD
ncbi:MAG: type II toxin-antitoxin system Phd/YefM family antitoxin [Terriglobales bacterium]